MRLLSLLLVWLFYQCCDAIFRCPTDSIDDYFPDPDDCTRFYRCFSGREASFECGIGTVFNPLSNNCDWPGLTECRPSAESSNLNVISENSLDDEEARLRINRLENRLENHKVRALLPTDDHREHSFSRQGRLHTASSSHTSRQVPQDGEEKIVTDLTAEIKNIQSHTTNHESFKKTSTSEFIEVPLNHSNRKSQRVSSHVKPNNKKSETRSVSSNYDIDADIKFDLDPRSQTKSLKTKQSEINSTLIDQDQTNVNSTSNNTQPSNKYYVPIYHRPNRRPVSADHKTDLNTSSSNAPQPSNKPYKPVYHQPNRRVSTNRQQKELDTDSLISPHNSSATNQTNYLISDKKPTLPSGPTNAHAYPINAQPSRNFFNSDDQQPNRNTVSYHNDNNSNIDHLISSSNSNIPFELNHQELNSMPKSTKQQHNVNNAVNGDQANLDKNDSSILSTSDNQSDPNQLYLNKNATSTQKPLNKLNSHQYFKVTKTPDNLFQKEEQLLDSRKSNLENRKSLNVDKELIQSSSSKLSSSKVLDTPNLPVDSLYVSDNTKSNQTSNPKLKTGTIWYRIPTHSIPVEPVIVFDHESNNYKPLGGKPPHRRMQWSAHTVSNLKQTTELPQKDNKEIFLNGHRHHTHSTTHQNEHNQIIDKNSNINYHTDGRLPRAIETMYKLEQMFKNDPYAIPDLVKRLKCNETNLPNCSNCETLNWLKFAKIKLTAKINDTIMSSPARVWQDCFSSCSKINCIAYSIEINSAICLLYVGPVQIEDVAFNENLTTVVKESVNGMIVEEWLYSDFSIPTGQEIAAYPSENKLTCLRTCITIGDNCKVIAFDYESKICKAFDKINGKRLALKSNHITLQHRSIHEQNDNWRFTKLGASRPNSSQTVNTFAIRDDQECFEECLNTKDCLFVSIGGKEFKECQLFNRYIPSISDTNYQNYFLKLPKNSSPFIEMSDHYFYGHPIAKYNHFDLKNCLEAAKSIKEATKVSIFEKEKPECHIFGDSAQLGNSSDIVFGVRSFKSTLPLEWEYMAFRKAIGVTLNSTSGLKLIKHKLEGSSALPCLKLCLKNSCELVTAHYLENEDEIECDIILKSDHHNDYSFVFNKSVELYARKLSEHDIPKENNQSERSHCSSKFHLLSADENMIEFEKSFNNGRIKKANDKPYVAPHGNDFVGMLDTQPSRDENRKKRSVYALLLKGASLFDQLTKINLDDFHISTPSGGSRLLDWIKEPNKAESSDQVLRNFINQIIDHDEETKLDEELISQLMSAIRKARQNQNQTVSHNPCLIRRGSVTRLSTCLDEEVCKQGPIILHGDHDKIKLECENVRVNSSCRVTCRSGYRPTESKVFCEQIGKKSIWNTRRVECVPDESICFDLPWIVFKSDQGLEKQKIDYIVKYDKNMRLPLFSIYYHGVENSWNVGVDQGMTIVSLPCPQLKGFQMSHLSYKSSNYTKGYLTSPLGFRYSQAAIDSVNYFVNVAPQDPFTKFGPWFVLETKLQAHLKNKPGFVISGICPQLQPFSHSDKSSVSVPKCFWKIVCFKKETGNVTAAAFYHENSIPISANEKRVRVEEVMSYTNPKFVSSLIGSDDYNSIWSTIKEKYQDLKGTKDEADLLTKCEQVEKLKEDDVNYWNSMLTNIDKGLSWPDKFEEGMVLPETESKNSKLIRRSVMTHSDSDKCKTKVIGYVGVKDINFRLSNTSHRILTHLVILSAIKINKNGSLSLAQESEDVYNRIYELKLIKKENPNLKLLFSIGGWHNSQYFSQIAGNMELLKTFIRDIIAFLDYWNIDGVDILWQYPVIGGRTAGHKSDKKNFVRLLTNLKSSLIKHQKSMNTKDAFLLTITGPGIDWIIDQGYDLKQMSNIVDWINIMAFDFFGPWNSSWGSYTGPHAPLYFSAPDRFPGKMNVESALKKYACETDQIDKLVLGVGFFGRYWNNVEDDLELSADELFKRSEQINGERGGLVAYNTISTKLKTESTKFHNKSKTAYIWLKSLGIMISYENEVSLKEKVTYALDHGLGGVMIWSLDMDDENLTLLKSIETNLQCSSYVKPKLFTCNPLKEKRYWTQYDEDGSKDRMCGKKAPLINGHYAICDPDDPGYGCCSAEGWCGSGPEFCDCPDCIDFNSNPEKVLNESIKPSTSLRWHTLDSKIDLTEPICGYNARLLSNEETPICNPDDPQGHCCSAAGFCGIGPDYCSCIECINFSVNTNYRYANRTWFDWADGPEKIGRCGPKAPKFRGEEAECNPESEFPCCGSEGFCGSGPKFCDCQTCINYHK